MSFEAVISAAIVTGRTLVLPSKCPWYLINWGEIRRDESKAALGGRSEFADFFDMGDLGRTIPTITSEEFVRRHRGAGTGLEITETVVPLKEVVEGGMCQSALSKFLRGQAASPSAVVALADERLNPLKSVIRWVGDAKQGMPLPGPDWIAGRNVEQLSVEMVKSKVLHFPMEHDKNWRWLGQNAAWWLFESRQAEELMFKALRDGFHYRSEVFAFARFFASLPF